GKIDEARRSLEQFKRDRDVLMPLIERETDPSPHGWLAILEQQLGAMIQVAQGDMRQAVDVLRAAAAAEAKLPYDFGPPMIDTPSYELLGEVLLDINDAKEARAAFEKALTRAPDRTTALGGLLRAAEKMGDRRKADENRAKVQTIWNRAHRPVATDA